MVDAALVAISESKRYVIEIFPSDGMSLVNARSVRSAYDRKELQLGKSGHGVKSEAVELHSHALGP